MRACLLLPEAASWAAGVWAQSPAQVTVRPEPTDEILANPGMGWETFHRTRDHDRSLPAWPAASATRPATRTPSSVTSP